MQNTGSFLQITSLKNKEIKTFWWLSKWATIQEFYTRLLNAIYVGIWIYYFICLVYKVCVCTRWSVSGCQAEWTSQWRFSDRLIPCGLLAKRPEPFLLPLLSSMSQPNHKWGHGWLPPQKWPKTGPKWKCVFCRIWAWEFETCQIHTVTSDFHRIAEKWARRSAPSACWVKVIKKRGLVWIKGMKVWLAGEITQSVSLCRAPTTCSSSADWHDPKTPQYISLQSWQTIRLEDLCGHQLVKGQMPFLQITYFLLWQDSHARFPTNDQVPKWRMVGCERKTVGIS